MRETFGGSVCHATSRIGAATAPRNSLGGRGAPTTHQQAGTPLGTVAGIVAGGAALP